MVHLQEFLRYLLQIFFMGWVLVAKQHLVSPERKRLHEIIREDFAVDEDLEDVRKLLKVCTSVSLIVAGLMFVAGTILKNAEEYYDSYR